MSFSLADEFPLREGLQYLNHAAVGVWPRRTARKVQAFAEENMRQGAADYPRWLGTEHRLRQRLRRLLGAPHIDDIALVKNTSEGLSLIAYGLDWQPGDNIVISKQEFPSNRIVWESLADQGVSVRYADLAHDDPEQQLLNLMDARTRLLSISSVQFGNGLRLDIRRLGQACRAQGVLFCVDAIQHLGALQFDAQECLADFVVADGHKWMLGPEGLAVFYSTPAARDRLRLLQYGWHMTAEAGDFDRRDWQAATSARRFEPGSPNMAGIYALEASLSLLQDVGMAKVEGLVLEKARQLRHWIADRDDWQLLSPPQPERGAGIVTFRVRGRDLAAHQALVRHLMRQDIICACRGGGVRLSPHCYTPLSDPDRLACAIDSFVHA